MASYDAASTVCAALLTGTPKEGDPAYVLPEPAGCPLATWIQSQTTYATLLKKDDGTFGVQVVKQKIWVEGVSYELQEIFGKAVQVDPMKHMLKPPKTKRLKLKYDELLSNFAFNFNLRRYTVVDRGAYSHVGAAAGGG